jgi:hypothetical protein
MEVTHAIAVVICGVALASCSSMSSNLPISFVTASTDQTLTIDSNPQGAEAQASYGGVCHTPCELSVPTTDKFTVTYTLDGYLPQTIAVQAIPPPKAALIDTTPGRLEPNPVVAVLQPAPPEPPPVKKPRPKDRR